MTTSRERAYERLLREAMDALWDELNAAGEADVRQHPTLRNHKKIAQRIDKALKRAADRENA